VNDTYVCVATGIVKKSMYDASDRTVVVTEMMVVIRLRNDGMQRANSAMKHSIIPKKPINARTPNSQLLKYTSICAEHTWRQYSSSSGGDGGGGRLVTHHSYRSIDRVFAPLAFA
jgi:hypothetical protein